MSRLSLRALAGLLQRLVALVTAVLVLAGSATAGWSYLWCPMMEQAVDACCCAPAPGDRDDEDGPALHDTSCCEGRTHGDIGKGQLASAGFEVPPAVLVAVAIAAQSAAVVPRVPPPSRPVAQVPPANTAAPIRAGPGSGAERAIRLHVIRC